MSWTDEQAALAVKYWTEDGMSAAEIARKFPGKSRNAVIGKITRMIGVGKGAPRVGRQSRGYRQKPSAPGGLAAVKPPKPHASVIKLAPPPPAAGERVEAGMSWPLTATALPLLALRGCHCRWPVGPATGAEQMFCGAARADGPYCAPHARIGGATISPEEWARKNANFLKRALAS